MYVSEWHTTKRAALADLRERVAVLPPRLAEWATADADRLARVVDSLSPKTVERGNATSQWIDHEIGAVSDMVTLVELAVAVAHPDRARAGGSVYIRAGAVRQLERLAPKMLPDSAPGAGAAAPGAGVTIPTCTTCGHEIEPGPLDWRHVTRTLDGTHLLTPSVPATAPPAPPATVAECMARCGSDEPCHWACRDVPGGS